MINNVEDLEKGIYHYNIPNHSLELLKEEDFRADCEGNIFEYNDCGLNYIGPTISGYNLFILLGILHLVVIILSKKIKKF